MSGDLMKGTAPAPEILVCPSDAEGTRLDVWLSRTLGLSRAELRALFSEGAVRADGRKVAKGVVAKTGMRVEVRRRAEAPAIQPADLPALRVLYEDTTLVAVDKPARVPSHPLRPFETGTVANALVARFPECAQASADPREGGLCHRLDVETSGVLLAARSREVWEKVREAFSRREVDKRYLALVRGPVADEGEIALGLRHANRKGDRMEPAADSGDPGRAALTHFRVLGRDSDVSLLEVRILTGVQHQIRAHLAAIGAPVVGDVLYGGSPEPALERFFLHAASLGLKHPDTGLMIHFECPLPDDLRAILARRGLSDSWNHRGIE